MSNYINGPHLRPEELVGALHDRPEWEAAKAAAQRRRERQRRNPVNRLRHRLHWLRHPGQHVQQCSCRGTGKLT